MTAAAPRVLVVDDETPNRKLLRMGLSVHGYHVIEATNGKNALELLGNAPDIIILDLGLPDIPGHELLRMIRGVTRLSRWLCFRAVVMRPARCRPSILALTIT